MPSRRMLSVRPFQAGLVLRPLDSRGTPPQPPRYPPHLCELRGLLHRRTTDQAREGCFFTADRNQCPPVARPIPLLPAQAVRRSCSGGARRPFIGAMAQVAIMKTWRLLALVAALLGLPLSCSALKVGTLRCPAL